MSVSNILQSRIELHEGSSVAAEVIGGILLHPLAPVLAQAAP